MSVDAIAHFRTNPYGHPIRGHGLLQAFRQANEASIAIYTYLSGNKCAINHYMHSLKVRYEQYQQGLTGHYGQEKRWSKNKFWSRRLNQIS
jgi:hypothetical protein